MTTTPATPATPLKRHALGLPAGSIRSVLALMVVALVCIVLLVPNRQGNMAPIPPYLIYLIFMILGHFFAAHGHTIGSGQHSPLYLPAGFVRIVIILALGGALAWRGFSDPSGLEGQFQKSVVELGTQPYLPLLLLGGFFLGVLVRMVVGRENPPIFLQDAEAWLSLLAVVGMTIAAIIHGIINPSLGGDPASAPHWEGFLAVMIAFYFGERS
jgi:hypothetical protein